MLQQSQEKQLPVKITSARMSPNKRLSATDEYTISKKAKIMQTSLELSSNNDLSNRYVSVEDALKADFYQTVDVEVKVLHKSPLIVRQIGAKILWNCGIYGKSSKFAT